MFLPHSFLWHYLWVAPNILLLVLGFLMWKRGLAKRYPAFFAFAVLGAVSELCVYAADVTPGVDGWTFWRVDWANVLATGVLKFVLIGEIFAHVFGKYRSVAQLGKYLIRAVGVLLILAATLAALYSPQDGRFGIIAGVHLLEQTIYFVESGLLVFIFLFALYFRLSWDRPLFGITLGLSLSSCVHLAIWALANTGLPDSKRVVLPFASMATYHLCVLIWFYFLLVPRKKDGPKPPVSLPTHNLEVWNEELERLLHQ